MKFIVIYDTGADMFADEFSDKEEALSFAADKWEHLTEAEKKKYAGFYVLESANPDEEAENHFDGTPIKTWK